MNEPIFISSGISRDSVLLIPYMPSADEWEEIYRDEKKLRAFAKRCLLMRNVGQPIAEVEYK